MEPGTMIRFCMLANDIPGEVSPMVIDTIERELTPATKIRFGRFTRNVNENDIHLNSKVISRRHAKIYIKKNKLFIRDTKSNFGTFVNGERLAKKNQLSIPRKIKSGDIVKLGKDFRGGINERQRAILVRIELDPPAVASDAIATDVASMMTN